MSNDSIAASTVDRSGTIVTVGTVIRVLSISSVAFDALDSIEQERVKSMIGNELSVYEVDQWGCAWVEKLWLEDESSSISHSLSLEPSEMEVVRHARTNHKLQ